MIAPKKVWNTNGKYQVTTSFRSLELGSLQAGVYQHPKDPRGSLDLQGTSESIGKVLALKILTPNLRRNFVTPLVT
jgi:hypothetical protein